MKKIFTVLFLLIFTTSFWAQIGITAIVDGTLTGGSPKVVEIYAYEDIADLSIYSLRIYSNGSATPSTTTPMPAASLTSGHYYYLVSNTADFASCWGSSGDFANVATNSAANGNGDDCYAIFDGTQNIDVYGEIGIDGSGKTWEYLDSYALRKSGNNASTTFNTSEWDFGGINALDGMTASQIGSTVPLGTRTVFPVELTSFTANSAGKSVQLNWQTATEIDNYGFEVERYVEKEKSGWQKIGFVQGHGNSNSPKEYSFTDDNIQFTGLYKYRLKQVDTDGSFEYSPVVEVQIGTPDKYELAQNYPNPFSKGSGGNPSTVIKYSLPTDGFVQLKVYDILGNEVANLVNENISAGTHEVTFDASGFTSGIYFYALQSGSFRATKKMMLIK